MQLIKRRGTLVVVSAPSGAGKTTLCHEVRTLEPWTWHVGGVQSIVRDPQTGILSAGADPRRDGQAVAF